MNKAKKGLILAIVSLFITTAFFVYGSFAYFTDSVTSNKNVVATAGTLEVTLQDLTQTESGDFISSSTMKIIPGQSVRKNVSVKNTGDVPVYVRVKFNLFITLSSKESGNESKVDLSLIYLNINDENWVYQNGYYFYTLPLQSGAQTENLLRGLTFSKEMGNLYKDSVITVKTRIESVQSNNNGDTVFDAEGWVTPDDSNGGGV
jgi:hypothetical protein